MRMEHAGLHTGCTSGIIESPGVPALRKRWYLRRSPNTMTSVSIWWKSNAHGLSPYGALQPAGRAGSLEHEWKLLAAGELGIEVEDARPRSTASKRHPIDQDPSKNEPD